MAGRKTLQAIWPDVEDTHGQGKWDFSTNGNFWAGKKDIPCIGFGPGKEEHAHTAEDQMAVSDLTAAIAFYAMLPLVLRAHESEG